MALHGGLFVILIFLLFSARHEKRRKRLRPFERCGRYISRRLNHWGIQVSPKILSLSVLILVLGNFLGMTVTVFECSKNGRGLTEFFREDEENGPYQVTLETRKEDGQKQEVTLTVPEQKYSKEKIETWFLEGRQKLENLILGENTSLNYVNSKLMLVDRLPDTPVEVSWVSSAPEMLDWEGNPGENIPESGYNVTLYAMFTCQDEWEETEIRIRVFPDLENTAAVWERAVQKEFDQINQENFGKVVYLPTEVDGQKVTWNRHIPGIGIGILLISSALVPVLILGKKQEEKNAVQKRQEQMMTDYPEILNKFSLLLNAGMNTRKAFAKVALDYRKRKQIQGDGFRPRAAYEEIVAVYLEMEQGIAEAEAYEHLGCRCGLAVYKTFSTLLIQNLKKGNRELLDAIEREAMAAFESRKRRAKILGDKAGTKLLIPMMIMLIIVFVILLFPACSSFM